MSTRATRQPSDADLLAIAASAKRDGDVFTVDSSDGTKVYLVTAASCSCPDWIHRKSYEGEPCKHMQGISLKCTAPLPAKYVGDPFEGFA